MRPNRLARLAGSVYLVQIFAGSFPFYVRAKLFEPDGAATAANVVASETLYRLGMLSEVLVGLTWLSIAFILFVLLKPVRKELSRLFLILTIVGVAAMNMNVVFLGGALLLFKGALSSVTYELGDLQGLGMLLLSLFERGSMVYGLFTGLWLLPLGYVVLKSGYLPKVFGVLLMVGCFGYVVPVIASYVLPEYESIQLLVLVSAVAEISFGLWLLFKGVKTPVPQRSQGVG